MLLSFPTSRLCIRPITCVWEWKVTCGMRSTWHAGGPPWQPSYGMWWGFGFGCGLVTTNVGWGKCVRVCIVLNVWGNQVSLLTLIRSIPHPHPVSRPHTTSPVTPSPCIDKCADLLDYKVFWIQTRSFLRPLNFWMSASLNFWSSLFDSNLCWIRMEFRVVVVVATVVIFIFPHFGMYGIRTHAHRLLSGLFNER